MVKPNQNIFTKYKEMYLINSYKNPPVSFLSYVNISNMLYGFSFRQLHAGATLCLRQWNNAETVSQNVGFVNGYVDTASILSFANGTSTKFEWYDQLTNTLKYVKYSTMALPLITGINGGVYFINNKIYGLFTFDSRLRMDASFPAICNTFQVSKMITNAQAAGMLNSNSTTNTWIGVSSNSLTGSAFNACGSPNYSINKNLISPINRKLLFDATYGIHGVHSVKNIGIPTLTHLFKGYNLINQYPPHSFSQEELWYNNSITSGEIGILEDNQIDYYIL